MTTSSCQTCGKPIAHARGGYDGPEGWYDPAVLDMDNDGRACELTGDPHVPGVVQPEPVDQ